MVGGVASHPAQKRGPMSVAERFDGFLIDLDGVVYVGDQLTVGAAATIEELRRHGTPVLFVTNDPRGSRGSYAARLTRMGVPTGPEQVLTASSVMARVIADLDPSRPTAYVIGSRELKREIVGAGIDVIDGAAGARAEVVVVGGHDDFNYAELRTATLALHRGAVFFATGRDATFPMPDGPWPATGAILAAVETAAGRSAVVIGKPEPHMFAMSRRLLPGASRLAIVGDRLDSDIAGGRRAGFGTVLVLTGHTTRHDLAEADAGADYVIDDLRGLLRPDAQRK